MSVSIERDKNLLETDSRETEGIQEGTRQKALGTLRHLFQRLASHSGLLLGIGAAMGAPNTAKAEEPEDLSVLAQEKDMLWCRYNDEETSSGGMRNNPKGPNDLIIGEDKWEEDGTVTQATQEVWKGYIKGGIGNVYTGEGGLRFFKPQNGQLVDTGKILGDLGETSFDIIPNTDIAIASKDGKTYLYKLSETETGEVKSELIGEYPDGTIRIAYGGYIFGEKFESSKKYIFAIDQETPSETASNFEIGTYNPITVGLGIGIDPSTNELVTTLNNGVLRVYQLPPLDQNGKLSCDFSLQEMTLKNEIQMPTIPGKIIANNGHKYIMGEGGLFILDPQGDIFQITLAQIFPESTHSSDGMNMEALEKNGIYLRLMSNYGKYPIRTIKPTTDTSKFIAPGVPFEVIMDTGPKAQWTEACTVIPEEYQDAFADPVIDPCMEVTCNDGNPCTNDICTNESGTAVCDNIVTPGASCVDGNACTTEDTCTDQGTCEGTLMTCAPEDQCHTSSCNETTGSCEQTALNETECDDKNSETIDDKCQNGICIGTEKPIEPDPNPEEEPDVVEDTSPDTEEPDVVEDTTPDAETDSTLDTSPDTAETDAIEDPDSTPIENPPDILIPDIKKDTNTDTDTSNNDLSPDTSKDTSEHDITEEDTSEQDLEGEDTTITKPDTDTPKKKGGGCSSTNQPSSSKSLLFTTTLALATLLGLRRKKHPHQQG